MFWHGLRKQPKIQQKHGSCDSLVFYSVFLIPGMCKNMQKRKVTNSSQKLANYDQSFDFHVFYRVKYTRCKTCVFLDIYSTLQRRGPEIGAGNCLKKVSKGYQNHLFCRVFSASARKVVALHGYFLKEVPSNCSHLAIFLGFFSHSWKLLFFCAISGRV